MSAWSSSTSLVFAAKTVRTFCYGFLGIALPVYLAELGMGDTFGEEALISGAHRNATVTMITDGVLMRLGKDDFNTLLMLIRGYTELLLDHAGRNESLRRYAEEIQRASDRATSLTQQLLAFSRKQVLEPKVLDLNTVVAEMQKMLQRLLGEDVELSIHLNPTIGRVKADPSQVEQVIMNLAVNSRDAMPRGGKLSIETANVELDESYARQHAGARPGRYVMLAVTDTGTGMDAATKSRIFEPFFTT